MSGLGAMMQGGNGEPQDFFFYPTPPEPVLALLEAEGGVLWSHSNGRVWEPCCGDGAIARVLAAHNYHVIGSDIQPRGFGRVLDFLQATDADARAIVTNPPYGLDLPEKMLRHAMRLKVGYVAMLLKTTYWSVASRLPLWQQYRPAAVYPLTWRVDFLAPIRGRGAPVMDVMWVVWRSCVPGRTEYRPLPRPVLDEAQRRFLTEGD